MGKNTLIQSYVVNRYFVSTALRDSSAVADPEPYYETLAWEWDAKTRKRGGMVPTEVDSGRDAMGALDAHHRECVSLASLPLYGHEADHSEP